MKLVLVEWEDAYGHGGWHTYNQDVDHTARCVAIGVLLYDNEEHITIAQGISNTSGNIADTLSIPRGSIKRIRYLRVK